MITSTSNAQIKELAKLQKKSRLRDEKGIFLVEGPRMTEEIPAERIEKVYASESFAKKNKEFLDACVERGCVVPINPYIVIKGLLEAENPYDILCLIKKMKYEQKNDWLYNFFLALSKENVNKEMLEELYEFLKNGINDYTGSL